MKIKNKFRIPALITGIVVTLFFLLAFGPKFIGSFIENGPEYFNEIIQSFVYWEDPSAFFITYFTGYAITWWRPFLGSFVIIIVSVFYVVIAGFDGPPIVAVPAFLVGVLYMIYAIVPEVKLSNKIY
ncbi:MAG: hypothetical protein R2764_06915 [Bacteroidales bacterium]